MDSLSLQPSNQFYRVEVAPNLWFYMNHEMEHPEHVAHDHNFLELAFILSGSARHITVAGEANCRRGEAYVMPKGAWHAYCKCQKMEVVNCLLSPQMLKKELAWLEEDPVLGLLLGLRSHGARQKVMKIDFSQECFNQLIPQLKALEQACRVEVTKVELLSVLLPVLSSLRQAAMADVNSATDFVEVHPAVRRALQLMHEQMDAEWTLTGLAEELKLNPSYFVRLFRDQIGESPIKHLAGIRAEQAANWLLSTRLRVGEIGVRVGWPDPKVFARKFRQHFSMCASDYRRQMLRP